MQSIEPMPRLFGVDWVIIVFYFFIIIILGIWLGRGQRNARDYFLGGRDLPWWGVALSILATETSALTFIGVPAMAYADNLGFIQIVLGYALGRVLLAFFMVQYYFKTEIYSPYALIGKAFGQSAQKIGALFFFSSRNAWCRCARICDMYSFANFSRLVCLYFHFVFRRFISSIHLVWWY